MQRRFSERRFSSEDAAYVVAAHTLPHAKGYVSAAPSEQIVIDTLGSPNVRRCIVLDEHGERAGLWIASAHDGWLVEIRSIIATVPRSGAGRFAVRSATRWGFEEIGAHRVWLEVTAANSVARRLYESEGFIHEGTYRQGFRGSNGAYEDPAHYGLLRAEYAPND